MRESLGSRPRRNSRQEPRGSHRRTVDLRSRGGCRTLAPADRAGVGLCVVATATARCILRARGRYGQSRSLAAEVPSLGTTVETRVANRHPEPQTEPLTERCRQEAMDSKSLGRHRLSCAQRRARWATTSARYSDSESPVAARNARSVLTSTGFVKWRSNPACAARALSSC